MSLPPIHPGEHLALELGELGMSAAELAEAFDYRRHRAASCAFFWHDCGILVEPAESL